VAYPRPDPERLCLRVLTAGRLNNTFRSMGPLACAVSNA